MYMDRAHTWPSRPNITYRRPNPRLPVAHAYPGDPMGNPAAWKALCGRPLEGSGAPPADPGTLICVQCYRSVLELPETSAP